ncbi:hypothetical protein GS966_28875 [Rhodococcus hoagii]|nr:hypothetical protein [Prescottella equi]
MRDYLRANGFPHCERTRAGYTRDAGDLHPAPGLTVQVKDRAQYAWHRVAAAARRAARRSQADHAVLVVKAPRPR